VIIASLLYFSIFSLFSLAYTYSLVEKFKEIEMIFYTIPKYARKGISG